MQEWLKSLSLAVISGLMLAVLVGISSLYNEVKANTSHNLRDDSYNLKTDEMYEVLIRIDENVKILKGT